MKKRILCLLLSLVLLTGLLPFGAMAEEEPSGFVASDELVEMIKYWEGFCEKPVWDYGQWTVGFGSRAPDEHLERYRREGISREEATELLKDFLESMGTSINNFIDKFGIEATQQQFDAMLSFTYNCGSGWTLIPCTLRTAFIEGWTGDDLVHAMCEWSNAGGVFLSGLARRRLCEANIYLNGEYSTTPPETFSYVTYNPNGGEAVGKVQGYINTEPVDVRPTATMEGCVFEGWYTDPTGGEKVEKLDATMNGYVLYAHWSAGEGEGNPQDTPAETITGKPVNYTKEVVSSTLHVFRQPVKGALVVDALYQGELVDIVAEHTDSSGVKWGQIQGLGWINLSYVDDPVDDSELEGVTVKVTGVSVNIRRGPGTTYACVGVADVGQEIVIVRTTTGGGYTWGKFSQGWIALKYTNYDDVVNESFENENNGGTTEDGDNNNTDTDTDNKEDVPASKTVMGTVTADYLYVRSDAGVTNPVVGGLTYNTRVEILEKKAVGGTIWGRTDKGWISLKYVDLDTTEDPKPEEPEQKPVEPEKPEEKPVTGKIKLTSGALNIRTGPSTGYTVCGFYMNGEAVTILEQKTVGTMPWGRTDRGWICLDYVKLDEQSAEPEQPVEPEKPAEPEDPVEPEQPVEPEKPAEPEDPVEPEQPVEPEKPVEPEQPVQPEEPEQKPQQPAGESGTVKLTSGCLRIRSGAGIQNEIVGNLYNGDKVIITERKTVGGTPWGKMDKGWICLDYVKFDAVTDSNPPSGGSDNNTGNNNTGSTTPPAQKPAETLTGTVKVNDYLCVRSGAGTNYTVVALYVNGNQVAILEQKTVNGVKWGRTDKGWICLVYVVLDNPTDGEEEADPNVVTGTVTGTGLRIRAGAGTDKWIVGSLTIGDKVTILETTTVNGTQWGRIESGWICLDYVKLD